jgi:hypothetical protein
MAAKIRGIDDCIEAIEDVADRLTSGTLTVADANATVRTAEVMPSLSG